MSSCTKPLELAGFNIIIIIIIIPGDRLTEEEVMMLINAADKGLNYN